MNAYIWPLTVLVTVNLVGFWCVMLTGMLGLHVDNSQGSQESHEN